jgi:hypothetical protein
MNVEIGDFPKTKVAATESLAHLIGKNGAKPWLSAVPLWPVRRRTPNHAA